MSDDPIFAVNVVAIFQDVAFLIFWGALIWVTRLLPETRDVVPPEGKRKIDTVSRLLLTMGVMIAFTQLLEMLTP